MNTRFTTRPVSRSMLIGANALLWGIIAAVQGFQNYTGTLAEGLPADLLQSLVLQAATYAPWALFTPFLYLYFRRFPIDRLFSVRTLVILPVIAGACIAVQIASHTTAMALYPSPASHPHPFWSMYASMLQWISLPSFLSFAVIVGGCHAVNYYERFREREQAGAILQRQLAEAHLETLQSQLQPHFFFNTLHAIASLVRDQQPEKAVRIIARLSDLFRHTLANRHAHVIPLRQELELLSAYFEIEQTRFPDRLDVRLHISPETLEALVPTLILQPLVENAVKHGVSKTSTPLTVTVSSGVAEKQLFLRVENDHSVLDPSWMKKPDTIGISNTQKRLDQLYGQNQRFDLHSEEDSVIAEVVIPLEYQPEEQSR